MATDANFNASQSYLRAQEIAYDSGLTLKDITATTPAFWKIWTDPRLCQNGAATTLFSIQYNLVIGTLGAFAGERKDLLPLIDDLLKFNVIGQFCLTELDHGLDAFNLETTATLLSDGMFLLNTPRPGASKFMPPTAPVLAKPCVSIVFAQLIVNGEARGVRPFIVDINDGVHMAPGVVCRRLPFRGSSSPVNHSLTSFSGVTLPPGSLLGDTDKPPCSHQAFLLSIWRVAVGTLSLSLVALPALKIAAHISYHYSLRRKVQGHGGTKVPILSFRTQEAPIYMAVSQAFVLDAFGRFAVSAFVDADLDVRVRHGMATCLKTVTVRACQRSQVSLSERCGAQGLFDFNQISLHYSEMRGISIAEGDILVLCIRLASEIVSGKYNMPSARDRGSLLALHEEGLISEFRALCARSGGNRSPLFAQQILPQCQLIVEAIGQRVAFDAATDLEVPDELICLYVCDAVKGDLAWYIEKGIFSRSQFREMEDEAILHARKNLPSWIDSMGVEAFVSSPIVSGHAWSRFFDSLEIFGGGWGRWADWNHDVPSRL